MLEVRLGRRPSFVSKRIWSACNLLKDGLVWKIGDDASVKIWKDKWLPTPTTYSVQSPIRILDEDARVLELIDKV